MFLFILIVFSQLNGAIHFKMFILFFNPLLGYQDIDLASLNLNIIIFYETLKRPPSLLHLTKMENIK